MALSESMIFCLLKWLDSLVWESLSTAYSRENSSEAVHTVSTLALIWEWRFIKLLQVFWDWYNFQLIAHLRSFVSMQEFKFSDDLVPPSVPKTDKNKKKGAAAKTTAQVETKPEDKHCTTAELLEAVKADYLLPLGSPYLTQKWVLFQFDIILFCT